MNTSGWLIYNQGYLLLLPAFKCEGIIDPTPKKIEDQCKPEYFCEHKEIKWSIVEDDIFTLDNWMKKFNLYCGSDLLISAIGMAYFSGFAVGAAVLPGLSDKYGRKWTFVISVIAQFLSVLTCVIIPVALP